MKTARDLSIDIGDVIEWDIVNWSKALDFWKQTSKRLEPGAQAIEIGSRHGGLSLWLASQGLQVLCTDLDGPSAQAKKLHQRYQFEHSIEYASSDCLSMGFENVFEVVACKSVLGRIGAGGNLEQKSQAIRQIYHSLKPGGEFLFAENLQGLPIVNTLRKQFVNWYDLWSYATINEMQSHLSVFDEVQYSTTGVIGLLGRSERQRRILGNFDQLALARLVPAHWRYVMYGVARKSHSNTNTEKS